MELIIFVFIGLLILLAFALSIIYLFIKKRYAEKKIRIAEETGKKILEDARKEAETSKKEAKLEAKD
ncbi:MAG: Rnase Y domain-containing protein, partial [bacterium]